MSRQDFSHGLTAFSLGELGERESTAGRRIERREEVAPAQHQRPAWTVFGDVRDYIPIRRVISNAARLNIRECSCFLRQLYRDQSRMGKSSGPDGDGTHNLSRWQQRQPNRSLGEFSRRR